VSEPTRNRWRGVPAGERTAERRALLIDAAFDLVGGEGTAGTTVRKVCEAARLNPRYFYESFEDLDALLVAVFERTAGEAIAAMMASVAPLVGTDDEELLLRTGLGTVIRHITGDPRRTRILFMEGLNNTALGLRRFELLHEMAESLVADAQQRAESRWGAPSAPPSVVVVAANLIVGGLAEVLMSWVSGRIDVTVDQLVDDTTALFRVITSSVDDIIDGRAAAPPPAEHR
jgi:AcrR family transcriptional regulator